MSEKNNCLEVIPKLSILKFYIKSIIVGLWFILKWFLYFLWKTVNQKRSDSNNISNSIEWTTSQNSDNSFYDKPPPCLIENNYGRHSYIKLKVLYIL